jgi:hypothetical protein
MVFFKKLFGRGDDSGEGGETAEFKEFLEGSMEGLKRLTEVNQGTWGLGNEERWDFEQDTGILTFIFPDKVIRTQAQIIGTFDSVSKSWMWSWANLSIAEPLTHDALRVREYGEEHGIDRLTNPRRPCDESDAWDMTALACRLCNRSGGYRGPAGTTYGFFTFGMVKYCKKT